MRFMHILRTYSWWNAFYDAGNPALSFAHLQAGVYALAKQPMAAAETGGDVFEGMMRGAEDFLKHTGQLFTCLLGVASGLCRKHSA